MEQRDSRITVNQAFRAMILFLEMYYKGFDSDILAGILSDLQICPDGETADPATGKEWLECLKKAIADENAGRRIIELPWRK